MRSNTLLGRCCSLIVIVLLFSTSFARDPESKGEWVRELDIAPADPRIVWSGTVLHAETREPITGAKISIMAHEFHPTPDLLRALRSTVTDSSGRFALPYRDLERQRVAGLGLRGGKAAAGAESGGRSEDQAEHEGALGH